MNTITKPTYRIAVTIHCVCATAILCLVLTTSSASAQKKGADTKAPPSFSTKSNASAKSPKTEPASDQDVADAIMADALNRMYAEAGSHFHRGEWNHCLNLELVVEQGDPHNVETYTDLAFLLWSTDRNDQAIDQLKRGIAANPNESYMYDWTGTHYALHLKDPAAAIPYFEKAIQYPCGWTTYHSLAHCYEKLGKWEKAVATWKQATKYGDDVIASTRLKSAEAHLAAGH